MELSFEDLSQVVPPSLLFQLTKPATMSAEKYYYEGIEDAEIVIEDVTAGIKDTLQLLIPQEEEGSSYVELHYYNYRTQKWNMSH